MTGQNPDDERDRLREDAEDDRIRLQEEDRDAERWRGELPEGGWDDAA